MKHRLTVSYLSFIIVTILYITVSSICHVNQQEWCYVISFILMILMFGLMLISIVLLII